MDVRTLFIAQTGALTAMAAMLWASRTAADDRNGMATWTVAVTSQGIAYLLLANAGRVPVWLSAFVGNALGAISVVLFFVAIRQFLGRGFHRWPLVALTVVVSVVAALSGAEYEGATVFNGFIYGAVQLLNGWALLRTPRVEWVRVQRVVAAFYLVMGVVLPLRATALMFEGAALDYINKPIAWQEPIYIFGFIFVIVTNLGFVLMCKMRAEADVRAQAMSDELTGLANRRSLAAAIEHALAVAARSQRPFAVVMIDLDHFKLINDRFGHSAGDATLARFATRLRTALRAQDQPFRYGGEEFIVLLHDADATGATLLAERLRQHVASPPDGTTPAISASLGVAVWQPGDSADSLLARADQALYRAKAAGRNRVETA
ncbi:diguanylate cyclase [Ideonella sp.]|uniref:GGDEF domain-containing protein n=1 Tax=Ideonella sp. TaxID=1929293 RepID=UPI0035B39709